MLCERLPVHIDPLRFSETGRLLKGRIPLAGMTRLADYLLQTEGEVEVELEFGVDDVRTSFLHGQLSTSLKLICQRCLGEMDHRINNDFLIAFVAEDKSQETIPEQYEPFLLDGELVHLQDLIEDELILALPIVPKHSQPCVELNPDINAKNADAETIKDQSPFAILSSLKK